MTTWQKAAAASSPGLAVLLFSLGWFVLDPKGDARQHLIDLSVRAINRARDTARI